MNVNVSCKLFQRVCSVQRAVSWCSREEAFEIPRLAEAAAAGEGLDRSRKREPTTATGEKWPGERASAGTEGARYMESIETPTEEGSGCESAWRLPLSDPRAEPLVAPAVPAFPRAFELEYPDNADNPKGVLPMPLV